MIKQAASAEALNYYLFIYLFLDCAHGNVLTYAQATKALGIFHYG